MTESSPSPRKAHCPGRKPQEAHRRSAPGDHVGAATGGKPLGVETGNGTWLFSLGISLGVLKS